jgi:hypothetical protein
MTEVPNNIQQMLAPFLTREIVIYRRGSGVVDVVCCPVLDALRPLLFKCEWAWEFINVPNGHDGIWPHEGPRYLIQVMYKATGPRTGIITGFRIPSRYWPPW